MGYWQPEFKAGDIIEFCDEQYEVLKNFGHRGTVKENFDGGQEINNFYWEFEGEKCKLIQNT